MLSLLHQRLAQLRADGGATMIEYGFMITGIAAVVGVAAAALGQRVVPIFTAVLP